MEAAAPQTILSEDDALATLEERIRKTVDLVNTLRAERDAVVEELEAVRTTSASVKAEADKLRQELDGLRSERKQVRTRIEKLLGQMDVLS